MDHCLGVEETIDLAGLESFPASDPPAWTPTHAGTPHPAPMPETLHELVQTIRDDAVLVRAAGEPEAIAELVADRFTTSGLPAKRRPALALAPSSIEAVLRGGSSAVESIVVAAGYDDAPRLLAIGRILRPRALARTVRFVLLPPSVRRAGAYLHELAREGPRVRAVLELGAMRARVAWLARRPSLLVVGTVRSRALARGVHRSLARAAEDLAVLRLVVPSFLVGRRQRYFSSRGIASLALLYGRGGASDFDRIGREMRAIAGAVRDLATPRP